MSRPRRKQTGFPSYCYKDARNGRLFMLKPDGGKLRRVSFDDLGAMLAAWRVTWGEAAQEGAATVADLLDAFVAETEGRKRSREIAATTATDYTRCAMSLRPVWERVRIEDADVPAFYRWRDARGEQSKTRANRELTALVGAYTLAQRRGIVRDNPPKLVQPFKERPRTRYVTDAEFMAVFAQAPAIVQAAMLLAAVTGLRQGDILRLKRSDFGEAGLTVKTRKTGQPLVFGWTEGLRRAVLLAVGARDFIPLNLLSTDEGKPYSSDGFRTAWHRARDLAKLAQTFTFNDLRAKAGSESRDWRLLGHMDQRTFERVYNRLPRQVTPTR